MGGFFNAGEQKIRSGVYQRIENNGGAITAGAVDGICAAVFKSDWGPLGTVMVLASENDLNKHFGSGQTVDVAVEQFRGGARTVKAVRLGTGGTVSKVSLKDNGASAVSVLDVESKYPGTRSFSVTVRDALEDETKREVLIFEGTYQRDKFSVAKGDNEVSGLLAAFEEQGSDWVNIKKASSYKDGALAAVNQTEMTPGTNPTVTNESYSDAFSLLESQDFNRLAIDSEETGVHLTLASYMNRMYGLGKLTVAVIGEPSNVDFSTRAQHAAAFNSELIEYVGGGFYDTAGNKYEGYRAAARISGMFASISSSGNFTHAVVSGADIVSETLTNYQYETAKQSGMILFSTSAKGAVWIDEAINTLVSLPEDKDAGWKKVKRTKIRFELINRINESISELQVRNNNNGRSAVIQTAQGVCNDMVGEEKLESGALVELDSNNPPQGESAWFTITADDIDALEKIYLTFRFRFSS